MFCGWGAQCARTPLPGYPPSHPRFLDELPPLLPPANQPTAGELATQSNYDQWLSRLADHGITPGTVVIDDRWQREYGRGEPDPTHWPDLRAWIGERHAAGMRVLLWWKAWDPTGVPAEECVRDAFGRPVSVDPGNPAYLERLRQTAAQLVSPQGLERRRNQSRLHPTGPHGHSAAAAHRTGQLLGHRSPAPHQLQALYTGLKAGKPDALLIAHTPHPSFADVCDMVRLNDLSEQDPYGTPVSVVEQLDYRAAVVRTASCRTT